MSNIITYQSGSNEEKEDQSHNFTLNEYAVDNVCQGCSVQGRTLQNTYFYVYYNMENKSYKGSGEHRERFVNCLIRVIIRTNLPTKASLTIISIISA